MCVRGAPGSTMAQPGVNHEHVKHVRLLTRRSSYFRLNDGPFRVLHALAFAAFTYCVLTYVPQEEPAAASTEFDEPIVETATVDILDGVVADNATADAPSDTAEEVYEMWEPQTPQDYVRVVWAILIVFHVLVNLFCIWIVRVKMFCQFSTARTIDTADHILCVPDQNHGNPDIVPIVKRKLAIPSSEEMVRFAVLSMFSQWSTGCIHV